MFFCDEGTSRLIRRKARQLMKHPALHKLDREDIEQELWLHVLEKQHHFDIERGAFNAFVTRLCRNKGASLIRYHTAEKRNHASNGVSLNMPIDEEPYELGDTLTVSGARKHRGTAPRSDCEIAQLRFDVCGVLGRLQADLAALGNLLKWNSKYSVANALNISRRQAHHHITHMRRRFEDAGLKEYL
ncbi:Sigma-70 region 2 [Symmachiella macrocystis]|uniref:Sigma-70 region 2 n=1 Tax=Symmachiella macrocystis TaxID=2527985 RepID=A0A5C6AX19_9PLAN|nr:sigma factor [Symmachiella macrocystis]TWU04178.1 Sigma-70 region 2 [Symmachiella macrocystis]